MNIEKNFSYDKFLTFINEYKTYIVGGLSVIALAVGISVYWYYSNLIYERSAQQALSEILTDYNRAHGMPELWQEIEVGARTGYRQYARSYVAPYFLSLQAEALLQQNNNKESLAVMQVMFEQMSEKSPLYDEYKIKQARIKMASSEADVAQDGLRILTALAHNKKNTQQLEALYYLGSYYESQGLTEKARDIWQQLVEFKKETQEVVSPWIIRAQQKLKD